MLYNMIGAPKCGFCDLTFLLWSTWKLVIFLNMLSCRQVERDCDFLEQERIMDYSMLVGLHFKETTSVGAIAPTCHSSTSCTTPTGVDDGLPHLSGVDANHFIIDPSRYIVN